MGTRLTDSVHWVECRGVNAYVVDDGETVTLIDTGTPFDGRRIATALDEMGHTPADVDRVLLTHFDLDHVGGFGRIVGLDAPVYVGPADAPLVAREAKPNLTGRKAFSQRLTYPFLDAPTGNVRVVEDGDEIGPFTSYHTPGHTPGHVCYVSESLGVGFLGDLVREADGELVPSPWAMSDDTAQVESSIDRLAEVAPPFEAAAMGHGVPFATGGRDRLRKLTEN